MVCCPETVVGHEAAAGATYLFAAAPPGFQVMRR
jgi:hypothetical protein